MRYSLKPALLAALLSAAASHAEDFKKKIDGGSEVSRELPNGTFVFEAKIDGGSRVSIHAPGGSISFPNRQNLFGEGGSKIDGKSKVVLEAKKVKFNAKIDGGKETVVLVILSSGGILELDEVNGGSVVYWCKAKDGDPEPTVRDGEVNGGSTVHQVKRAAMEKLIEKYELKP